METIICLVRHGQTNWNKQRLIQVRINNPLNDEGRLQVKTVGKTLKQIDPTWDIIIASPLDCTIESAKILAEELNYTKDIIINPDVIEREFGEAEGQNICDKIYQKIINDDVIGLETSKELQTRAYNALMSIAEKYPNEKILIATHSHFIKGFYTGIDDNYTFISPLYNASLNYVYIEEGIVKNYIFNKVIY